ncbi:hypothetical protein [Porphyromonas loveana]|uniref:hypothetical protein n=1 Tax=Porphyromonas loveana TaxID=1884669 RepID=UPI00359F9364
MDGQTDVLSFFFAGKDNDSSAPTPAGCLMADVELLYLLYNNVSVLRCACLYVTQERLKGHGRMCGDGSLLSLHISPQKLYARNGVQVGPFSVIYMRQLFLKMAPFQKKFGAKSKTNMRHLGAYFGASFCRFLAQQIERRSPVVRKKNYLCKRQNSVEGFVMLATTRKNAKTFFSKAH